jgi:serine/threonine protein kinase
MPELTMIATQVPHSTAAQPPRSLEEVSPVALVDALLDAALAANADYLWIEPVPMSDHRYVVSVQQDTRTLATTTVPSALGMAAIARLAFLCEIDLLTTRARTGSTRLRHGDRECELVLTLRPGSSLRAEATLLRRAPRLVLAEQRYAELGIGERVDHYRILARLGAGGMGSVYKAEHVSLGRVHALKVLQGAVLARDQDASERFLREARAASRIRNPNIVDVFDFGYLRDGRPYFVMELLSGTSLGDLIDRGALPPAQAVSIARQLGNALAAAHERGVIHADVTPSNVLIDDENQTVKLVDFGLAELRDGLERPADPSSEYVLGTPCYISPEQIRGLGATEQSDQYALGIVLYEMLAGHPPFQDRNVRDLCIKHLRDPVPEVASPRGPLPPELGALLQKCLQKSPVLRYASIRAMLLELEQVESIVDRRGWRRWLVR